MSLLKQAEQYWEMGATVGDIMDINCLKGKLSQEYAKALKQASDMEEKYNQKRYYEYKSLLVAGKGVTEAKETAKAEAELSYGGYRALASLSRSILCTIDQLKDIVIGLQYVDKHLSDVK